MNAGVTILDSVWTRTGASSLAMVLLLVMILPGDGALVSALRGSPVEGAPKVQHLGYYEALADASEQPPGRPAWQPPAGWTPFGGAETGIVREVPNYLRWTMKPDLDLRWNGTVFRTNHRGLRSPEI